LIGNALAFWNDPNLIQIGSVLQQSYLTYIISALLEQAPSAYEKDDILFNLREGIQKRITKVGEDAYKHALWLWKQFIRL